MENHTVVSWYNKMLDFSYGNKVNLMIALKKGLALYKTSDITNPRVKKRIELYSKTIEYAKKQ